MNKIKKLKIIVDLLNFVLAFSVGDIITQHLGLKTNKLLSVGFAVNILVVVICYLVVMFIIAQLTKGIKGMRNPA